MLTLLGAGPSSGSGLPAPPAGFSYLIDSDGNYVLDSDGNYILITNT